MKLVDNLGGGLNPMTCRLDRITGGTQTLATLATAGALSPEYVAFTFDTNGLTVDNGAEVQLQAICDTTTGLPVAGGNQVSASIESATQSIEWSDNVQVDILGAGKFIFQTDMPGYTAKITT
jgi:hypothetical protein